MVYAGSRCGRSKKPALIAAVKGWNTAVTKTLWIFNHYAAPPMGRHQALAEALRAHGWQTFIFSASTSRQEHVGGKITELDGVHCRWLGTPSYDGNGVGRIANMAAFTVSAMARAVAIGDVPRPDAVWGSTVHPGAPLAALQVWRRFKVPFIYEVRDLWPETFVAMGRLTRNSPIARALYLTEHQTAKRADLILSPLDGIGKYFEERYAIPQARFKCIPNGIQASRVVSRENIAKHEEGEKTIFSFAGAMGNVNGLDLLLDAFTDHARMSENTVLKLIGDGPKREEIQQLTVTRGLTDRVVFTGWVPFEEIPSALASSDWNVAVIDDLPQVFRYGVSYIKIPEYMAAGRPILLAANTGDDLIKQSGGGLSVLPNRAALAQAFTDAASTPRAERQTMAVNGRDLVLRQLTYDSLAADLAVSLGRIAP